jgi:hypothetical protein
VPSHSARSQEAGDLKEQPGASAARNVCDDVCCLLSKMKGTPPLFDLPQAAQQSGLKNNEGVPFAEHIS